MKTKFYLSGIFLILLINVQYCFAGINNSALLWNTINAEQMRSHGMQLIAANHPRYLALDVNGMRSLLSDVPMEGTIEAKSNPLLLEVPMPDGGFTRFAIAQTPVMHPVLAAKYPMIKTFSGQGLDDATAVIRIDVTQFGFHAMILSSIADVFIDPINLSTSDTYICYYKKDEINQYHHEGCAFDANDDVNRNNEARIAADVRKNKSVSGGSANRSAGTTLSTYRLAMACTGEYATFYGGTVTGALAGIVTSVNRITGVYEYEMDIRMVLIANDDTLIFLDPNTDPYDNNNGATMLGQNQSTVTARIGAANYDIGHVFSTGGGGIAGLGIVCLNSQKANGVTGLPSPSGDGFDIDFVCHEMGHQYGANHTFNSVTAGCNGNRNPGTAYEPGSGITIMGYAGTCGSDDMGLHSIPYFHTGSFDEIQNYTTLSNGANCPVTTPTGNNAPISALSTFHYDIPLNTPFKLTGAGSDPDGDTITYAFDELDNGAAGAWNAPVGNAPIFKPNTPTIADWRLFPKLSDILINFNTPGDLKPTYARTLHFRMTLRDNRNNGGGVTYDDQTIDVAVINTVNPFAITYPNTTGISWTVGATDSVTWDVVGSTAAPISTNFVNIYLSTTGGNAYPFPVLLAANVPNTGSYVFTVPNVITGAARVLVEAVGNIFLDINAKNFSIVAPAGIHENNLPGESVNVYPVPADNVLNLSLSGTLRGVVTISLTDAMGRVVYTKQIIKNAAGMVEPLDIENYARGVYFVRLDTEEGIVLRKIIKL